MIENLIFPLDYIILAFASIVIIFSFWKGVISSILGLLTWIGSIIITIYFYNDLANFINSQLLNINLLKNYEQITNLISIIITIPLIFLLSLFILKKLRRFISSDLDKQILGILIDKVFGFLFGFILNYLIFTTIIYCSNNFEFISFLNNWLKENSSLIMFLNNLNNGFINNIIGNEEVLTK